MLEIRGVLSGCCVVWTWNVVICSSGVIGAPDNRAAQYFPPWFNIDRSDFLNKWYFVSYLYNPVSHPPSRFYCILPWFCIKWLYKHVQIIFTNFVWPFYPLMIQSWLWSSMPIVVWLIGTATANNTIQHKSASTYCMARLSRWDFILNWFLSIFIGIYRYIVIGWRQMMTPLICRAAATSSVCNLIYGTGEPNHYLLNTDCGMTLYLKCIFPHTHSEFTHLPFHVYTILIL